MAANLQTRVRRVVDQARAEAWPLSVVTIALLIGILGLRTKARVMTTRWSTVARWLGLNDAKDLSFLQQLDFLGSDFALAFAFVPAVAIAAFAFLPRYCRFACAAFVYTILLSLTYFHTVAHQVIGQYLSWGLMMEAIEWGTSNPDTITDYLTPASLLKLGALIGVTLAALATGHRVSSDHGRSRPGVRWPITMAILAGGTASTLLCVSITDATLGTRRTPMHESALWTMTATLLGSESKAYAPKKGASYVDGTRGFRAMTGAESASSQPALIGSMRRANVVMFVVETGTASVLDLQGDARSWDGISQLVERSFIARNHLTTYPYTSDAVFSLLSGLYPSGRRQFIRHWSAGDVPGLFTALRSVGYATAVFAPSIFAREFDGKMYRTFGIDDIHNVAAHPERDSLPLAPAYSEQTKLWTTRGNEHDDTFDRKLRADAKALAAMLSYIGERRSAGQPFAVLYLPQASHAPWHGHGTASARGRLQMQIQTIALAEIVRTLETLGELDNTIIVFTADHGIRTKIEDPALETGFATPYMFQTPLLIFAPRALGESREITAPTSHVDIAPTVLALLGHPEAQTTGVGVPIWDATTDRRVYFLAEGYGGFNGFVEKGEYFQFQAMTDQSYGPSSAMELHYVDGSNGGAATAERVRRTFAEYAHHQSLVIGGLMASARLVAVEAREHPAPKR